MAKKLQLHGSFPSKAGLSAYEVAKSNGFEGTETEWLASLVGPPGPRGESANDADTFTSVVIGESITLNDVSPVTHTLDVRVSSKNHVNYPYSEDVVANGITYTPYPNGAIVLEGTATANSYCKVNSTNNYMKLNKGETYTLSGAPSGSSNKTYCLYVQGINTGTAINEYGDGATFVADDTDYKVIIKVSSGITVSGLNFAPMVEPGDTLTKYTRQVNVSDAVISRYGIDETDNLQTFTPAVNGVIEGMTSLYPTTNIISDVPGIVISCSYKQAHNAVYESLREQIRIGNHPMNGKKVVFMGDSIFGNNQTQWSIPSQFSQLTGAKCCNLGFSGTRAKCRGETDLGPFDGEALAASIASGVYDDLDNALTALGDSAPSYFANTVGKLKNIDFNDVDYVIINYGTNDWTAETTGEDYYNAMINIVRTLQRAYPTLIIYKITPIPRFVGSLDNPIPATFWPNTNNQTLRQFAAYDDGLRKQFSIPVIPMLDIGINNFNKLMFFPANDFTHPNDYGCRFIAEHIARASLGIGNVPLEVEAGIPIPSSAQVGQTIVVKAVDEDGKPTEWEAADFPSGGGEISSYTNEPQFALTVEEDCASILLDTLNDIPLQDYGFECVNIAVNSVAVAEAVNGTFTFRVNHDPRSNVHPTASISNFIRQAASKWWGARFDFKNRDICWGGASSPRAIDSISSMKYMMPVYIDSLAQMPIKSIYFAGSSDQTIPAGTKIYIWLR